MCSSDLGRLAMGQLRGRVVHLAVSAPATVAAPLGLEADPHGRSRISGAERQGPPAPELLVYLAAPAVLLAILLSALKAAGAIVWPWSWVLSPLWGLFAAVLLFSLFFAGLAVSRVRAQRRSR